MNRRPFTSTPIRIFLINTAGALVQPLFSWAFRTQFSWDEAWKGFEIAFIYAQLIGSLFQYSIPWMWRHTEAIAGFKKWIARVALVIPFCTIGALAASFITVRLRLAGNEDFLALFRESIKLSIVIGLGTTIVASAVSELRCRLERTELQLRKQELDRERVLKQASEARLSSLESRVHPHFLFNTINSVSSLIHDDPVRAERLLERMAALLRFSLDSNQNGVVPVDREMKIVSDYLEIEKTRFGDRLTYSVDVQPGLGGLSIPPLAVQTVVENSVKYAVAPRREGGRIAVAAKRSGDRLLIDVWDDGPDFSMTAIPSGHGLENLQGRLSTLFGDAGQVVVIRQESGKTVRLTIPVTVFAKQTA